MEFKTKKQKAIFEAGKQLFWKIGIKKVSVEDICAEAGVSRMTYYKYYSNKIALVYTILKDVIKTGRQEFEEIFIADYDFKTKLEKLIDLKLQSAKEISKEMLFELYSIKDNAIRNLITEESQKSYQQTIEFLNTGKKEGCISKDMPNEFILYQLDTIQKQLESDTLYNMFKDSENITRIILDYFFHGIMNVKDEME